jgi:mandelamide amidase
LTRRLASIAGFANAGDMLAALRQGKISSAAIVELLLSANEANNDLVAFSHVDAASLRRAAAEADAKRASGVDLPLLGLPICVKDNIDVAGVATTAGTPALENCIAAGNAPVLQRLLDQGAIVFGKARMHELAYGTSGDNAWKGPTLNPFARQRIPGGSSSGTAAAIAAGIVPAGLGTDTGGSVRIPAAFCGLAGLRPTSGRYPGEGIFPISATRDTAGPLARCFEDLALLDAAICRGSEPLAAVDPASIRLGVPDAYFFDELEADVARISSQALDMLRQAGVTLVPVQGVRFGELYRKAGFSVTLFETGPTIEAYLARSGWTISLDEIVAGIASPDVRSIMADIAGRRVDEFEAAYRRAIEVHRPALQEHYAEVIAKDRLDGIVFPTTKLPALLIGEPAFDVMIENTGPGSLSGVPGISVPCGATSGGVPLGISIDGPFWSDRRLLGIGAALQQVLPNPWKDRSA